MISLCAVCGEMAPRGRTFCSASCSDVCAEVLRALAHRHRHLEQVSSCETFGDLVGSDPLAAFRAGMSCALEVIGIEQRLVALGDALGERAEIVLDHLGEPLWARAS
jgi:hypothetical protein